MRKEGLVLSKTMGIPLVLALAMNTIAYCGCGGQFIPFHTLPDQLVLLYCGKRQ